MSDKAEKKDPPKEHDKSENKPKCGIIMPIADNPDLGYPPGHWAQVRDIIITAAEAAGFEADMVSNDVQVDIIHSTIIKNIYINDVAVCDVSSRNPNVMFELGLRIASQKPVILIKDEATPYSFDTQLIPHLAYRRDLRMFETLAFQKELKEKIITAHKESQQAGYKSFLGQFTSYTLAQIDEKEVGAPEYIAQMAGRMQGLEDSVKSLATMLSRQGLGTSGFRPSMSLIETLNQDIWTTNTRVQRDFNPSTSLAQVVSILRPRLTRDRLKKLTKAERAVLIDEVIASDILVIQGLTRSEIIALIESLDLPLT